jgi:hypothetical protein
MLPPPQPRVNRAIGYRIRLGLTYFGDLAWAFVVEHRKANAAKGLWDRLAPPLAGCHL